MSDEVSLSEFEIADTEKALFVFRMTCAAFTVIGCWIVIRECTEDLKRMNSRRSRKAVPIQIISMTVAYAFHGGAHALGSTMGPRGSPVWGTMGNQTTCTMQGFLIYIGIIPAVILNVSVISLYTLIVRYNYKDNRLWSIVIGSNILAWTVGLVMAGAPVLKEAYGFTGFVCGFLVGSPSGCEKDEDVDCIRGGDVKFETAWRLSEMVIYAVCLATGIQNLLVLYWSVRNAENRTARYRYSRSSLSFSSSDIDEVPRSYRRHNSVNRRRSNSVAVQANWYIGVFFTAFAVFCLATSIDKTFMWSIYLAVVSLLGFFNAVIFSRARKMRTVEGKLFRAIVCVTYLRRGSTNTNQTDYTGSVGGRDYTVATSAATRSQNCTHKGSSTVSLPDQHTKTPTGDTSTILSPHETLQEDSVAASAKELPVRLLRQASGGL